MILTMMSTQAFQKKKMNKLRDLPKVTEKLRGKMELELRSLNYESRSSLPYIVFTHLFNNRLETKSSSPTLARTHTKEGRGCTAWRPSSGAALLVGSAPLFRWWLLYFTVCYSVFGVQVYLCFGVFVSLVLFSSILTDLSEFTHSVIWGIFAWLII